LSPFFIDPQDLFARLGRADWPLVIDTCRPEKYAAQPRGLPTARWRNHLTVDAWAHEVTDVRHVVVACVHGHNVSQSVVAALRGRGVNAQVLRGGVEGWIAAGLPTVTKSVLPGRDETKPSRWITRVRPKIDRIACPWLITRFIDSRAQFQFVEPDYVLPIAQETGAVAYDIAGAPFEHNGPLCTFDTLIDAFGIKDNALATVAKIVRGADTAVLELAPEAAGLLAISLGVSVLAGENDHEALERGFLIYDALYAWARSAQYETHNWPAGRVAS
jgi:rhodanese-related sulfurtransferase